LEVVDLIITGHDHTLHTYVIDILRIRDFFLKEIQLRIRDVIHGNGNKTLVHVLMEHNMCAYFMTKE